MATITRVPRAHGHAYQARIKRRGRILKTKTFRTKTAAREWARRLEADLELATATGDPGQRLRFRDLCGMYLEAYDGRDHHRLTQVVWWQDRITRIDERLHRKSLNRHRMLVERRERDKKYRYTNRKDPRLPKNW